MTAPPPPKDKWTEFLFGIYGSGKAPVLGTVDIKEIEDKAREAMKDHLPAYMYTFGSAGTCSTHAANRKAFDRFKIVPRMLRDATARKIETTILGVKYPTPLFVAPVGVQGILHADGEAATAGAAGKVGVPYIMSTASTRSIEQVAEANGPNGQRWYQLYWPRTSEVTLSLLKRAKANGFTSLVITLDTMLLGWRPHDIETAYIPFGYGVGIQVGTSDPVFMARHNLPTRPNDVPAFPFVPQAVLEKVLAGDKGAATNVELGKAWLAEVNSGVFRTWEDLKFVRDNWDGPIFLKGIQHLADAEKAIECKMDGIIVSNHGGRQVDGAIASLDALDTICKSETILAAQASGKFAVLFDSGIRTGSDIIKALALGAQGVLIARPFMYSLAIAGQPGVEQILNQLISDLHITMGLSGYNDINQIIGKRDEILRKVDYLL
ncbi:FMN-dependent alpha-hydroxy acid dehydrogenase [Hygrophoropsis aurantiaca]|uniref:FMN-dependent alpha-hydroxy acid dehydrogenase n=1 Tax=Hygrophoropsis aurantiaca TaxID=72124 RepID=A0ACB7ZYA6_9AGAM|nr:FMN-dependent alpha-hydroxy acid dehydrogenase [Hygrophoropsis aurantiaca]